MKTQYGVEKTKGSVVLGYYSKGSFCSTIDKAEKYEDYNIATEILWHCREDNHEEGELYKIITV